MGLKWDHWHGNNGQIKRKNGYASVEKSYNAASELQGTAGLQMDTKTSKCVHLVEGGTNSPQYVNMAPMGRTSLGRVTHARKRQKTSFANLETHGDGSCYRACDTCSSGVPKEIVPAGIVPIGNILVGNNIGVQTRTKGCPPRCNVPTPVVGSLLAPNTVVDTMRAIPANPVPVH